ncbi:MAG: PAS domain S-box protein, partial [Erysipelotrichaceae bacterium]|nr:PAS domain S-box protein [Erysipelotrichaceae bacterium]
MITRTTGKHKNIDKELAENIGIVIKQNKQVNFEFHSELINGHLKVEIHSTFLNKVFIFVTDITKEVNETIEKSILLKTTNDIILELDENYVFTSVYTNYEKDLFIDKEHLISQNIKDIFNQETSETLIEAFKLAKETNTNQIISYKTIENYKPKYFLASIFYVKFDHEYRYVISIRDITNQQLIENQLLEMNHRLTEIAKQSRTVIWEVDLDGKYTFINSMSLDVFGYENDEMMGKYFYDFYPDENRLEYKEKVLGIMSRHETVVDFESPYQTKNGDKIWLLSFSSPKYSEEGIIIGYRGSDVDITEKHKIQLALKQSEEKYRFITENTSDVIWIVNLDDFRFTYISPAVTQLRGFSVEEAMSQSINQSMTEESWTLIQNTIENTLGDFILDVNHPKNYILTIEQFHKNGSKLWVEISVRYRFNELNQIEIIGISRDVTERKKVDDEIRFLSFHDQLTGLYNRRYYDIEVERINTTRNCPISFITADINGLKMTND